MLFVMISLFDYSLVFLTKCLTDFNKIENQFLWKPFYSVTYSHIRIIFSHKTLYKFNEFKSSLSLTHNQCVPKVIKFSLFMSIILI